MAIEHLRKTVGGDKLYARVAEYDSAGNKIVDSFSTLSDSVDAVSDSVTAVTTALDGKANLVQNPTTGHFVSLTSSGDIADSGYGSDSLVPSAAGKTSQVMVASGQGTPVWSADSYGDYVINDSDMDTFIIGGTSYVAMKVGNLWWMLENLDYKFSGCVIGASSLSITDAQGNYYNDDEATYGRSGYKCGLLYNFKAVSVLNDQAETLISGWRVPTRQEWVDYLTAIDGEGMYRSYKFKRGGLYWAPEWVGTNELNFNVLPAGCREEYYVRVGRFAAFWSSTRDYSVTDPDYPTAYAMKFDTTTDIGIDQNRGNGWLQYSVRLVRDVV